VYHGSKEHIFWVHGLTFIEYHHAYYLEFGTFIPDREYIRYAAVHGNNVALNFCRAKTFQTSPHMFLCLKLSI
jgi:hypothetical protein